MFLYKYRGIYKDKELVLGLAPIPSFSRVPDSNAGSVPTGRPVGSSIFFNGTMSYRPDTKYAFPHQRYFGSKAWTEQLTGFHPTAPTWLDPKQVSQWNTHSALMGFQLNGAAYPDRISYPGFYGMPSIAGMTGFLGSGGLPQPFPAMGGGYGYSMPNVYPGGISGSFAGGGYYGGGYYNGGYGGIYGGYGGNNNFSGMDYLAGGLLLGKGAFTLFG